ncbi:hypothetical protein [Mesorhizobium sp. M0578]
MLLRNSPLRHRILPVRDAYQFDWSQKIALINGVKTVVKAESAATV